ncbi:hypothetical protein [Glaciihabitans sp. dw_435]|uniref:hypothetical protein n=1 Tax=Glaciihabitans sp. dw_435 TaxID=2720081 RepID=UPI001BD2D349|nr:hypothetical protein [Glaciihabitans sp. dw_435]
MSDYDEFLANHGFADAFTAVYRGPHSPANALWWLAHPEQAAPDDTASPGADRARLQGLAYSREGGAQAQEELAHLEERLVTDRAITLAAVAEARDLIRPVARGIARVATSAGNPGHAGPPARAAESVVTLREDPWPEASAAPAAKPRRWRLVWAAVGAVLVLAVGVGIGSRMTPAAVSAPESFPASSSTAVAAAGNHMFDAFATEQAWRDTPERAIAGTSIDLTTIRMLGMEANLQTAGEHVIYVARDNAGAPCLIVVLGKSYATAVSCVPEASITVNGISAYVQDDAYYAAVTWAVDGTASYSYGQVASAQLAS